VAAASAYARAALLGHPSDGFGGRTIAFTIEELEARVTVEAADATSVGSIAPDLLIASLERFRQEFGGPDAARITCQTTIPRQVGLGGSSAIVIAALRALAGEQGARFEPSELAAMALAVESEDLGIAAGPQDRVAQAHEGLIHMDFSEPGGSGVGSSERLDRELLPPLLVAFRTDEGRPSSIAHRELRARHEAGDRRVRSAMAEAAALADEGRAALDAGDHARLADLLDLNFELRRDLVELDPVDMWMAEFAQERGAGANYAGSGGAIVAVPRDPARLEDLKADLAAEGFGCVVP